MIFRLALTSVAATLVNLNVRTEKSGPNDVPAADLEFQVAQSADKLDELDPQWKPHLFDTAGEKDLADGMSLAHPDWHYPLKIDGDMQGAKISIDVGIGKPIVFDDVKVGNLRITPMEGGSVVFGLRAQCEPDEKQAGKLYMLQGQKITLTLEPPELSSLEDGPGADDGDKPAPKKGARGRKPSGDGAAVH